MNAAAASLDEEGAPLRLRSATAEIALAIERVDPRSHEPAVVLDAERLTELPEHAVTRIRIELQLRDAGP